MGRCKSKEGITDHEEPPHNAGGHEAGKGLKHLAHGGVADDDDSTPNQALLKMLRVEMVQCTAVRLEHLPVLLLLAQKAFRLSCSCWEMQADGDSHLQSYLLCETEHAEDHLPQSTSSSTTHFKSVPQ